MKIKKGYMLKCVAGCNIVVSSDVETMNFSNMINLNETGAFLWKCLENDISEGELLSKLMEEYEVSENIAKKDICDFLENLRGAGLLDE